MRTLLSTAAVVGLSGLWSTAGAVPVTFEFNSTAPTEYVGDAADDWYVGLESLAYAKVVLDLDSIVNLRYSASWASNRHTGELEESIPGALVEAFGSAEVGGMAAGFPNSLFGSISITTNAFGMLTGALLSVGDDTPDLTFWSDGMAWGDCCETWYQGPGTWTMTVSMTDPDTPAPVPLPASVALMGTALAVLGGIGGLARRKARFNA